MEAVVEATDLTKTFGEVNAVDGISFSVGHGEAFGILGQNGAGKTTTMRMIAGTSRRTGGRLRVLGLDPQHAGPQVRARLGIVPQTDTLDQELRVRDNLLAYGHYFGIPRRQLRARVEELLEFVQLEGKADSKIPQLSGGMRRRLTIARSLVNNPEMLLLDEPTTGLDPQARHVVWDKLVQLKETGVTLVLTTHFMDEAERLCDRLLIMDSGTVIAEGSPPALIQRYCSREVLEFSVPAGHERTLRPDLAVVCERLETLSGRLICYTDDAEKALKHLLSTGALRELPESGHLIRRASLEDVFLHLTGRSLVE